MRTSYLDGRSLTLARVAHRGGPRAGFDDAPIPTGRLPSLTRVSEQPRKLDLTPRGQPGPAVPPPASLCTTTGLTIPECSCRRCVEAQLKRHAPWLLDHDPDGPQPEFGA